MEMQASRTLAVSQQQAWEALNDPEVLKLCIPGCDKVEPTGDNQYAVAMALKIGPVSAKFAGKITLSDIVPPESYHIAFDGSGGVAGFGQGVFYKRAKRLGALRHIKFGLRHNFDIERRQHMRDFTDFALVAGGDDQFVEWQGHVYACNACC